MALHDYEYFTMQAEEAYTDTNINLDTQNLPAPNTLIQTGTKDSVSIEIANGYARKRWENMSEKHWHDSLSGFLC